MAKGEKQTHPIISKLVSSQEDEVNEHSLSVGEYFLYFVNSTLLIFCKAVKNLECENTLSTEVPKIMSEVKTQNENSKHNVFFGFEVNMSLENFTDAEQQIVINSSALYMIDCCSI